MTRSLASGRGFVQLQQFGHHRTVKYREMNAPDLTRLAATIGDASRIRMLALLMEGRALTAKEMALGACIEPATATAHLRRLLDDGLVISSPQGRHKYFRLAGEDVANLVEAMMIAAPKRSGKSARQPAMEPIRRARYCYDHVAGTLGTSLLDLMYGKTWLVAEVSDRFPKRLALTAKGEKSLESLGLDLSGIRARRRQFACTCLDWSERRDHLGGALGAALATRLTELGWIARKKHSRVVAISASGELQLRKLGVKLPA
jgi:DNA-binding transcriptional ArsR family regulator